MRGLYEASLYEINSIESNFPAHYSIEELAKHFISDQEEKRFPNIMIIDDDND